VLGEHARGDLDEVGLQPALVPLAKDRRQLVGREVERVAQQVVGLCDELDVGVLDAVVHHLHEVPSPVGADVGAAGHAVDLGGDRGEHVLDALVGLTRAARHEARPVERTFLPARHTRADEAEAELLDRGGAPLRVLEEGVAAVDDGVALAQHLQQ